MTDKIIGKIDDFINNEVSDLCDNDYLEVLEEVSGNLQCQIDAKRSEVDY